MELSELDCAVMAAKLNADTVNEQRTEIRRLEAENARLTNILGKIAEAMDEEACDG